MAFATTDDVATRLGRDLTVAEDAFAEQVIEDVQGLILEIAGTAEPSPVPTYYKALCVSKVIALGANPTGLASESETLGAHTYSKTFPRSMDGLDVFLTEHEEYTVRRIANNAVSGSSHPDAIPHAFVTEPE